MGSTAKKPVILIAVLVLAACAPSTQVVQTAIAQTQAAYPTATSRPIPTATPQATNTPSGPDCVPWDQIDKSYAGKTICAWGLVQNQRFINGGGPLMQYRILFSSKAGSFFLLNEEVYYTDLKNGDCVYTNGLVQLDTYKTPFIKITDLYSCAR